jgi:hypothetical protein
MKRFEMYIFLSLLFFLNSFLFSQSNSGMVLLPDSNILVCGGNNSNAAFNDDCFIHFPYTKGATIASSLDGPFYKQYSNALSVERASHTMTLLPDGRVLIAGGYTFEPAVSNTADILTIDYKNPLNNPTRQTVNMSAARMEHTATLLTQGPDAGNVLICGGKNLAGTTLNSCEIFITSTTQFKPGPTMTSSRTGHSASLLPNGKVFIAGGYSSVAGDYMLTTELYDPNTGVFAPGPSLLSGRAYHTATTLPNGFVILIGGFNGYNNYDIFSKDNSTTQIRQNQGTHGFLDIMEVFDQNGARAPTGNIPLPFRAAYLNSTLLTDGRVFVDGGFGNIAPTYFQPSITISTPSYVNFTNPVVAVSTGNRIISIAAGSNIKLPLQAQLSRQVLGRVVDGDIFMPPSSQGVPTIAIRNVDIYFGKTTAQLDTFAVTGDEKKGFGWFEKENTVLTLYNPHQSAGSYAVFKPLSLMTDMLTAGSFRLYLEGGGNLSSGTVRNITSSTGTIGLNFPISDMYNGATITGTVTLKSLGFSDNLTSVQLNNGYGPISATVVNGRVNTSVNLTGIKGVITNTTDHAITFPYNVSSNLLGISFDLSFTANQITINQAVNFTVDPSTIVIRRMVFGNLSLYYPKTNTFYLNPSNKMGILTGLQTYNHSTLVTRNGTLFRLGGQNCESNPSNCNRTTPIMLPSASWLYMILYPETQWLDFKKLNNKRAYHTATVLKDGNILVCGGTDGVQTFNTCELYDRKLEDWIIVATMTVSRAYHTATLLPNGTVLLVGGTSGKTKEDASLKTCDIYYPDVKKIVQTADMTNARLLHTATLLPNGNVLVLGGSNSGSYLREGEIFISTANMWVPLPGTMANRRSEHTATLLKNNRVLIAGGVNGTNNVINNCELFDISNRTFSNTTAMNNMRKAHTATLLDDGTVVVIGGSNGSYVVDQYELYNPDTQTWSVITLSKVFDKPSDSQNDVYVPRANHNALLLPNNDIVLVGGESKDPNELVRSLVEYYNNHILLSASHGTINKRIGAKTILDQSNNIITIGGFDGANKYLDSVQKIYYTGVTPDQENLESLVPRKPSISSATLRADNGEFITFVSTYSNLHSVTEVSGGGSAGRNTDFYKPHIVLRSLNENFMINLSTMLYNTSVNTNWNTTLSTITINIPPQISSAPYGWYYLYDCTTNICSDPYIIQVSTPRPSCSITNLAAAESASTTSIRWNWSLNTVDNANGFAVFSASDVFITTVPFPSPLSAPATYYQTGLLPNTPSAIKVGCYNIGGFSDPSTYAVAQSTVYTKANPPKDLAVTYASFDTVDLAWDGSNNNPDYTAYQVEISTYSDFSEYATIMSFVNNYKLTTLTIRNLEPNWRYYFRVKARNGNGVETVYDIQNPLSSTFNNPVSTITVGNIIALDGTPLSPTSIKWSWNKSGGATGYEIYEYKVSTNFYTKELEDVSVFLSSTPYNYYTQVNLSTNTSYVVKVRSYKQDAATYNQLIYGPFSISGGVYTLAAVPAPSNNVFTQVTTGSFKVNWDANGNTDVTRYRLDISQDPNFASYKSYEVKTDSTTFPYIYEYVSELKPNYKYYARVYALNEADKITDTAANLGYKYTLAQPVGRVYVTSVTLSGVTVNWDPKENSPDTIYQVRATSVSFESPYVSTPVPFGKEYKGTSYVVNGLWINTTYYFDVSARNVEGQPTAEIQTTTPAVTLAGPAGAPPSSIAGVTDPNADTEITGILIDNRPVVLYVPKESFNTPQPLAVAKLNSNPCGYTFGGSTITFGIYANAEPYVPVKFTFDYFSDEAINPTKPPDINTNKSKIALARYNPDTGQCLPVKTVVDSGLRKITADLNHFSLYQLIILSPASDLNNIKVFPNPFYPNRPAQGMITITNLPENSKIKIYTISGQKVFETESDSTGTAYWEGLNSKGQMVGSGVYLCHIKSNIGSKTIKIAVER